tara:strand:- start:148 stop:612 length:465 start_codon:yes stop_codon:yes gene_type:complete
MKKRFSRKKGPVRSKKVTYDGIKFASGLEKHMYIALQKAGIKAKYEGKTYELQEGFMFDVDSYERQGNGKGDMVNRGQKKILNIKYTPDFVADTFIIECKGRANESFPLRWKMFKKHVKANIPHVTLYKPQNQKECEKVVELIIKNKKENESNK